MLAPLALSTPQRGRIRSSHGFPCRPEIPPGTLRGQGLPDQADLVGVEDVALVKVSPSARLAQSRMSRNSGVVPIICCGTQLRLP